MRIPFFDIKRQYKEIQVEAETAVKEVLASCTYIGGHYVQGFERKIEDYLNVKHAIGCANGTDALVLALTACGVKRGDEVITTPFSFYATAEAIAQIGAIPVFVDIRFEDFNIDPGKIENAITDKTKAIMPVHIFGAPCEMDEIVAIAKRHGLRVIEDAAQAIGSEYKCRKTGTIGDVGCFSFYPTKNLGGMGDGGMVTTNDDALAVNLLALREHGAGKSGVEAASNLMGFDEEIAQCEEMTTDLYDPYKYYNYLVGYNSRLDAIQASLLSLKLKYLDSYNDARQRIAVKYRQGLSDSFVLPQYRDHVKPCYHQFAVLTDDKDGLCRYLQEREIGCGTFYPIPLHKQKAFREEKCFRQRLPVAEEICSKSVCLPVFPELSDEEVATVIETMNAFAGER